MDDDYGSDDACLPLQCENKDLSTSSAFSLSPSLSRFLFSSNVCPSLRLFACLLVCYFFSLCVCVIELYFLLAIFQLFLCLYFSCFCLFPQGVGEASERASARVRSCVQWCTGTHAHFWSSSQYIDFILLHSYPFHLNLLTQKLS